MADSAFTVASAGITGKTPSGAQVGIPVSGRAAGTSTPLAPNATWSCPWLAIDNYIGVATTLYADQTGSYVLEYSEDGIAVGTMPAISVNYTIVSQTRKGSFSPSAKFVRFTYTNGATAQTKFIFNIDLNDTQTQPSTETLNAIGADTRMAVWNKSRIETKDADVGTYAPVYRTANSLNVHVDNQPTNATNPTTATVTSPVISNTAATQVLAANTSRRGVYIATIGGIYLKFGAGASASSWTVKIAANGYYELPQPCYTGVITALSSSSGTSVINVTEVV